MLFRTGWFRWLRVVLPALGLVCALSDGNELLSQETFSRWAVRPANSAARASQSGVWLGFESDQRTGESHSESPFTADSVERTAYQTQYPLSGDSSDLLPDESRLPGNLSEDPEAMEDDREPLSDEVFEESSGPWVLWKKTTSSATWIAPKKGDGLGITTLDLRGSIEFPEFQAVWFVPRVGQHWLNGPQVTDLPAQLYDFSFETLAMIPVGKRFFFQTAIAPSLFSDLQNTSHKAFRLPGRLLGFLKCTETFTLNGGVLYLNRDDVTWLPVAGLLWNPSDDWKFELMAPRPRIAWRFSHAEGDARWAYVVGEFGGGTWAIRRASGVNDVATLRDYRLMLGIERNCSTVKSWWFEAGYVFSRRVQYTSGIGDSDLASSALARAGLSF